jgi:peptidoglycan biosynthesis protein MviN/MurJ (putative lipid II flippase)
MLWAYSAVALYRASNHRTKARDEADIRGWAGLVTKGDLQQVLALIATQGGAIVLNRVLTKAEPGTVRDYNFAFKIASVGMLPCVVAANRLLKSMGMDRRESGSGVRALADHAIVLSYAYGFSLTAVLLWLHDYVLHVVFFRARFSDVQYEQMGQVLLLLSLGLPAVSQVYVWTRVNAVRGWNEFTLASSVACLGVVVALSGLQAPMGAGRVATIWALGVCVQALLLIAGGYWGYGVSGGRFDRGGAARAVVYCVPCTAVAATVWLAKSHAQWPVVLVGGFNVLLLIHFVATGWKLLSTRMPAPTVPELKSAEESVGSGCA